MQYGADFSRAIDRQHAAHDYELNFWKLAAGMSIPVIEGTYNSAVYLPSPLITLSPDIYHSLWSFTRFHEMSHIALRDSGIEQQLWQDADCVEQFRAWVEAYCNFGATQYQMPNPLLREVLETHGYSPEAILALSELAGVDLFDAMTRVTHGFLDAEATRTSILTQGSFLRKAVTTNRWFPHQEGDRIPEIALTVPEARLLKLPAVYGRGRVLGFFTE